MLAHTKLVPHTRHSCVVILRVMLTRHAGHSFLILILILIIVIIIFICSHFTSSRDDTSALRALLYILIKPWQCRLVPLSCACSGCASVQLFLRYRQVQMAFDSAVFTGPPQPWMHTRQCAPGGGANPVPATRAARATPLAALGCMKYLLPRCVLVCYASST